MNKARMTIRFDHENPKERDEHNNGDKEERLQPIPSSLQQTDYDWPQPTQWSGELQEADIVYDAWSDNAYENVRERGRLAEPRRRIAKAHRSPMEIPVDSDNDSLGDAPDKSTFFEVNSHSYDSDKSDSHGQPVILSENVFAHDWGNEQLQDGYAHSTQDYGYYRKRNPTSFWKMAAAVTGAVITGLVFGYAVLSFFEGGRIEEAPGTDTTIQGNVTPSSAAEQRNPERDEAVGDLDRMGDSATQGTGTVPQTVESTGQTFYMLQYGVFSTPERAEQAKLELLQSGIAASKDPDEENRVYAGISPDREQAKLLSNQLKNEGMELYVREMNVPGAASAVFAGEMPTGAVFFESGGQLVFELSSLSARLLGQSEAAVVEAEVMDRIIQLHQQWIMASGSMSTEAGPEAEDILHDMEKSMNSSITALSEYNKNRSKEHLWEIQTGMMDYVMGQKRLLNIL